MLARARARQERGQGTGRREAVPRGCTPAWPWAPACSPSAGRRETPTPQAQNLLPKQSQVLLLVEGRDQGSWKGLAAPSFLQPFTGMAEIPCSFRQELLARIEPKSSF